MQRAAAAGLEQQSGEGRRQHAAAIEKIQTLETQSADLKRQLTREQELRLHLETLLRNRWFWVRMRRSIHEFLDYLQPRLPESLRRAVRRLHLPLYRFFFPSGRTEFETLDRLNLRSSR